jgi:hypothetical protein
MVKRNCYLISPLLPVMPTMIVGVRMMPVITTVVWPSKVKGKDRDNRPSPPPVVVSRRRWWSGVIPDHLSRRTTDFFDRFLYQLSILPNPLPHFLAIGVIRPLRNGFNCMPASIIINHRFAIPGCISGRLIILIYRISD